MEFTNIKLRCIKGIPIDSVQTRTLSEIGFPVEAQRQPDLSHSAAYNNFFQKLYESPYSIVHTVEKMYVQYLIELRIKDLAFDATLNELRQYGVTSDELISGLISGCVYSLSSEEADIFLEEFVFIIENMLPRQLSDIYNSFDIEPNPAHGVFFDLAVKNLGIPKYTDRMQNNYGQFISHTDDGVKRRILSGESFQSIYTNTCATKTIINDAFRSLINDAVMASGQISHQRRIEHAIFGLSRQYTYEISRDQFTRSFDYVIRENGKDVLAILYFTEGQMVELNDLAKEVQLNHNSVPLLVLDYAELENGHISTTIRNAVKDHGYAAIHNEQRRRYFKYGKALNDCYGNWGAAETASLCGCFSCGKTFAPDQIIDWSDEEDACCPYCSSATVIMDSQGYEITDKYLQELMLYVEGVDVYDEELR